MNKKTTDIRPCYFLKLEVENIACFGSRQVLNLEDENGKCARWTVILGDNAIGKTTLLRCLAGISPYSGKEDMVLPQTHLHNWKFEKDNLHPMIEATMVADSRFSDRRKKEIRYFRSYSNLTDRLAKIRTSGDFYYLCCGYGASRRLSTSKIPTEAKVFTTRNLFDDDAPLINAEEWLLQLDYASARDQKYLKYRKLVESIILNLLPDITGIDYRVDKNVSNIVFETPSGSVGIHQLALGYRSMLAWLIDFANSLFLHYPNSENPLAEPAILLLDEIDLHLHPRWQRTIVDYLTEKFPNTQFIVTAHSPLLVQAAENANIVLLKRSGDEIIIDNDPISVKNWRVDQILTSDLFGLNNTRSKKLEELFEQRTHILSKKKLTAKDQEKLEQLDLQLDGIPYGNNQQEIEADFLIKKIAEKIGQRTFDKAKKTKDD